MFSRASASVYRVALSLLLGGVLLTAGPGRAGILDASWTAPTTTSDGTPLTDLAYYRVYYGPSEPPCPGSAFLQVASPTASPAPNETVAVRLTDLSTGALYYVSVTAVDANGRESACATPLASAVARIDFAVSPTGVVNFGSVDLGGFTDQTFAVSNTSGGTVSGTASTSAPFNIVSGNPFSLAGAGATGAVVVRFTPTIAATASTNVSFTANGGTVSAIVTGTGSGTDTTPPIVAITSPTINSTYTTSTSSLTLGGTASDDVGVAQVVWTNSLGGSGTATGTSSWMVSGIVLQPGTNVLTAAAQDAAGNTAVASLAVTLADIAPPTVAITAPTAGAMVKRTVTVSASASDNVGVMGVQFRLDGTDLGAEVTTAPYSVSWDTTAATDESHTLTAVARDAAGNTATSAPVSVTVSNNPSQHKRRKN